MVSNTLASLPSSHVLESPLGRAAFKKITWILRSTQSKINTWKCIGGRRDIDHTKHQVLF